MVVIEVDDRLSYVEKRLGNLSDKAPKVICKAINETAKWARREIAKEAQKTYLVKTGGFNKSMEIKNARYSNLEAIIKSKGKTLPLKSFKFTKPKSGVKAQVLKDGGLKILVKDGKKAFYNKIGNKNDHYGIAQRTGRPSNKDPKREAIKELFSNSIPKMLGNEKRVYGIVEPRIESELDKRIEKHIKKVLEGYE